MAGTRRRSAARAALAGVALLAIPGRAWPGRPRPDPRKPAPDATETSGGLDIRGFLGFPVAELGEEMRQQLESEFGGIKTKEEKLFHIQNSLAPMFRALPKNAHGRLGRAALCYALRRYFLQAYGWVINGLEPQSSSSWSFAESSPLMAVEGRVPAYFKELLERGLGSHGLGLEATSVLAFVLEQVLLAESDGWIEKVFKVVGAPAHGRVHQAKVTEALDIYMMTYLRGLDLPSMSVEQVWKERNSITDQSWTRETAWIHELQKDAAYALRRRANPFVEGAMTLEDAETLVVQIFEQYKAIQLSECRKLKSKLHEMEEVRGSGRVNLTHFAQVGNGADQHWAFTETAEELRELGALDEADPSNPRVVVPNYVYSGVNCLAQSGLHRVCCADECEALMAEVERSAAAPTAPAGELAAVVSGLSTGTVEAPRALRPALLERLEGVAARHGGRVPLHGRLFAQWMHHAFPNECAHPKSAKVAPHTPLESLQVPGQEPQAEAALLPWSEEEELLAGPPAPEGPSWSAVSALLLLAALATVAAGSSRTRSWTEAGEWKRQEQRLHV